MRISFLAQSMLESHDTLAPIVNDCGSRSFKGWMCVVLEERSAVVVVIFFVPSRGGAFVVDPMWWSGARDGGEGGK